MPRTLLILLLVIAAKVGCAQDIKIKQQLFSTDTLTRIAGDFNGDKKEDSAFVIPALQDENGFCLECISKVVFNCKLDTLVIEGSNGVVLFNVGDLDGNGADDLLIIPGWYSSCLGHQYVYLYRTNHWENVAEGEMFRCDPFNTIKKIRNGVFTMMEYDWNIGYIEKTKRIK